MEKSSGDQDWFAPLEGKEEEKARIKELSQGLDRLWEKSLGTDDSELAKSVVREQKGVLVGIQRIIQYSKRPGLGALALYSPMDVKGYKNPSMGGLIKIALDEFEESKNPKEAQLLKNKLAEGAIPLCERAGEEMLTLLEAHFKDFIEKKEPSNLGIRDLKVEIREIIKMLQKMGADTSELENRSSAISMEQVLETKKTMRFDSVGVYMNEIERLLVEAELCFLKAKKNGNKQQTVDALFRRFSTAKVLFERIRIIFKKNSRTVDESLASRFNQAAEKLNNLQEEAINEASQEDGEIKVLGRTYRPKAYEDGGILSYGKNVLEIIVKAEKKDEEGIKASFFKLSPDY